ncbi:hypothetical protein [Pseudoclavibacter sp. CFCC 11306]|uniref:hypothetical protein n=1 Tax=Pseudoclavibacter sp. CFCC 11306 TaxID=1564493 RepID=UPI0013013E7C|nr:hypothetical protein [Pseudoclavibacter sp. CFCC 11306]KAB1658163.1 hypothetical protein F8O09_00570 [Pseudoclavibacter sp. CFCC 11306]
MKHTLEPGRSIIDALDHLGHALGYSDTCEHVIGRTAAVDLSWTAADYNDVPLFVFEVGSTASAGLANNALKVSGRRRFQVVSAIGASRRGSASLSNENTPMMRVIHGIVLRTRFAGACPTSELVKLIAVSGTSTAANPT